MNKLMGFFELQRSSLPAVPWKEYNRQVEFDHNILWTIRTAIIKGDDLNLPRLIGCNAQDAKVFADKTVDDISGNGMVIYYPFFIAEKSGTMNIFSNKIIIEAVRDDLWNLVTYSDREVTIIISSDNVEYDGNEEFLATIEIDEICKYVPEIRYIFRDYLIEGKSILVEWSYALNCDKDKNPIGDKYLVFYEARTVN